MSTFKRISAKLGDRLAGTPAPAPGLPAGMVPAEKITAVARERAAAQPAPTPSDAELLARRERLTERFAAGQAELGGILYEMAIRDHVRLDVLVKKAAALQRVDLELADVERELRGDIAEVGGQCTSCGARHAKTARFCASCGTPIAAGALATSTNGTSHQ